MRIVTATPWEPTLQAEDTVLDDHGVVIESPRPSRWTPAGGVAVVPAPPVSVQAPVSVPAPVPAPVQAAVPIQITMPAPVPAPRQPPRVEIEPTNLLSMARRTKGLSRPEELHLDPGTKEVPLPRQQSRRTLWIALAGLGLVAGLYLAQSSGLLQSLRRDLSPAEEHTGPVLVPYHPQ